MDTDVHAESISVEGEESISVEGGRIRFDTHHLNTSAFLNDMRLIEVPDLSDFWQLRCLHLENNFITNTRGLGVFNSLQVLAMRSNRVDSLQHIGACAHLRVLDLSNNLLRNLVGLEKFRNLERIDVSGNIIDFDGLAISGQSCITDSLKSMDLKSNPVTQEMHRSDNCAAYQIISQIAPNLRSLSTGSVVARCHVDNARKFLINLIHFNGMRLVDPHISCEAEVERKDRITNSRNLALRRMRGEARAGLSSYHS